MDDITHPSASLPRLHLGGRGGRHGAQRGAQGPSKRRRQRVSDPPPLRLLAPYTSSSSSASSSPSSSSSSSLTISDSLGNSPGLVRALLLHLHRLVQLAVRGAEVVVPLHDWDSGAPRAVTLGLVWRSELRACACGSRCVRVCVLLACALSFAARLKRSAFPRCHFNGDARRRGRRLPRWQPITAQGAV